MSTTPQGPARAGSRWRGRRLGVAVGLAVAVAVALGVVGAGGARTAVALDPQNPGPDGTRALVSVLEDRGVEVDLARDADALRQVGAGPSTTVVVSSVDDLGASSLARLRADVGPARLVLLEPGPALFSLLGGGRGAGGVGAVDVPAGLSAECATQVPAALARDVTGLVLAPGSASAYPGPGCYPAEPGRVVLLERDGVVVLGAADALTNAEVLDADHAALGLRLLGGGERLVWYVPSLADLEGGDAVTLGSLLPPWVVPGLVLAGLAMLLVALWRGRRLGALATEPLPVVVRAVETTLSRGRLYRRAGDRAHAADVLRAAAASRLASRLGSAAPHDVSAHTGRDEAEVARLLAPGGPPPTDDEDLIMLAQDLDRLDREAHHP